MQFCKIDNTNKELFERFIPPRFMGIGKFADSLALGMYDDDSVIGAAIVSVYDGTAEIEYLTYRKDIAEGACEEALTNFLVKQPWKLWRIRYVADGDREDMDIYDFIMMWLGYAPSKGEVCRYSANLSVISKKQMRAFGAFLNRKNHLNILKGKELTEAQIAYYNDKFSYARYDRRPDNEELSCFLVQNNLPMAGIIAEEGEDGVLEFAWMDGGNESSNTIMEMIFTVIKNAMELYDVKTKVVICPYLQEVADMVSRFGFEEDEDGHETRIYTYYIN